jgi:hypothetical protein
MTGHQQLIAMRLRGKRPAHVSLWDIPTANWSANPETHAFPDIHIQPEDIPERLDLRFLVGLPVFVNVDDLGLLKRLVLACERAGASRVYGINGQPYPADGICFCTDGEDQTWRT